MLNLVVILFGGAFGAAARYLFMNNSIFANTQQLLIINVLGSFVIGFVYQCLKGLVLPMAIEKFLVVGFLGGFTTFSAYSLDIFKLLTDYKIKDAFFYILVINFIAIIAVGVGMFIGRFTKILFIK